MTSGVFDVDPSKCVKCGACVDDCFFGALAKGLDGMPEFRYPEKCMRCQHCLAICPTGAVMIDGRRAEDSVALEGLPLPDRASVENWLKVRRSTRRYRQKDVERGLVSRMLETLSNCPTGCNARSLTLTCYPDMKSMGDFRIRFLKALDEHSGVLPRWLSVPAARMRGGAEDMFFRGAPTLLIVSSDVENPAVTTPEEDVVAACTYFEMIAQANGLGTCWCGFLKLAQREVPDLLEKTSGIPRTRPFSAMLFGYPSVSYRRGVQREGYAEIVYG